MSADLMAWDSNTDGRPPGAGGELAWGLATLLVGAAIGAAVALLLTPGAGQDLRTRVAVAAGNWKEQAAEALAQGRESVVSAVEQAQSQDNQPRGSVRPV